MSLVYIDNAHDDLIWMEFDGPTWDEFHVLVDELAEMTKARTTPYCLIFVPTVDMPKGSPMPHIRRLMNFMDREAKFELMIAVVPKWMRVAAVFTNIVMKMFHKNANEKGATVGSREEAFAAYAEYHAAKQPI